MQNPGVFSSLLNEKTKVGEQTESCSSSSEDLAENSEDEEEECTPRKIGRKKVRF